MSYPLAHDDLILLTRLLSNHLVGTMPPHLQRVCNALMDYAERTTGDYHTPPLQLEQAYSTFCPDRIVFKAKTLEAGA